MLEGVDVAKSFGGLRVLTRVSFAVREGEIVALIGPNGAGKTTLFNLVSGLIRPSAGLIRMGEHVISAMPAHRIARLGVGRTFQTPRPFLDLSASENVAAAARFAERVGDARRAPGAGRAGRARAGARQAPHRGAMRKLLELAMALALGPRVILLDEVLAGLTAAEAARATATLRRIRDERGIALFWVEHVMKAVMATAERLVVLHHGEIICEGPPAAVSRDPRVLEAYLGASSAA